LAKELLKKETLDLLDIISCIGDRPYPLPDSIKDYLEEIKKRKEQTELKSAAKPEVEEEKKTEVKKEGESGDDDKSTKKVSEKD
jgi:hypothetical protein